MRINFDWNRKESKIKSNQKRELEKPRNIRKVSSKSPSSLEKIGSEFINSIKTNHTPGKLSVEIGYSLDNQDEDQQGTHVKTLNKEHIQELKRILNLFDN